MRRNALVTGANRGIGLATAQQLAELGNFIILGSRDRESGEASAESLRHLGLDASPVQIDLNDHASIDAAISSTQKSGRAIDILINYAGVLHEKPLLELTDDEIAGSIAVHLTGPIRLARALVPKHDRPRLWTNRQCVFWMGLVC